MFTGIVEATGEVREVVPDDDGIRVTVGAPFAADLDHGQSVAVSGACLTVEGHDDETFDVFLSAETVERTYLGDLEAGEAVNLERALPADGRFDGHFVQGHVDGTGEVREVRQIEDDWLFAFSLPDDLRRYVVEKGSIAVDGISLTVADLREDAFAVAVIPATYDLTTLSAKSPGDPVHLEVDVVAKYVESLTDGY